MKKSIFLVLLVVLNLLTIASVFAQNIETKIVPISDVHTTVTVELNPNTVKCSSAGYRMPELKVLVPALTAITQLNHQKPGEKAPCISAGACSETLDPTLLLQQVSGTLEIPVEVKTVRNDRLDIAAKTCYSSITETVISTINGLDFESPITAQGGDRPYSTCASE